MTDLSPGNVGMRDPGGTRPHREETGAFEDGFGVRARSPGFLPGRWPAEARARRRKEG